MLGEGSFGDQDNYSNLAQDLRVEDCQLRTLQRRLRFIVYH